MLKTYDEVIKKVRKFPEKKVCGVCMADEAAIEGALKAEALGIADLIFIGNRDLIEKILKKEGVDKEYEILHVDSDKEGAEKVVALAREEKIDFILKGHIETATLMRAVVDKEKGLQTGKQISHMSFEEIPTYHKLVSITDGGITINPTVDQKEAIINNAVEIFHKFGYEKPKIACLAAVEKVNPKMQATLDAAELKERNQKGQIEGCIVEGPISFDLAYSPKAAEIKGYESEVAGDPDIFLVPDVQVGNILDKSINFAGGGKMSGFVVGAKCLIILTSRSATAEEKYLSMAMAALATQ